MKVLFAVNNESVSNAIVKKYQKDYKEIISYKNVYFFNAIIKEVQKDKTYDRIVISEDLEPFANNNYETIDRFLFEKLDNISDEATDGSDKGTQIILICSDRRIQGDNLLVKLFGIGVYSALIGQNRSVEEVCKLINTPRTKKEAKAYYKIDSEDVNYQAENDTDVDETEIQNILKHYKALGKNEDKYVESFNNIANQYTDAQLRIIIKFLPLNVKAVLEAESTKYQEIVTFGDKQYKKKNTINNAVVTKGRKVKKDSNDNELESLKIDAIENRVNNPLTGKPIIIPSAKKQAVEIGNDKNENTETPPVAAPVADVKRGRGRPKKVVEETAPVEVKPIEEEKPINLFDISEETNEISQPQNYNAIPTQPTQEETVNLFSMGNDETEFNAPSYNNQYNYTNEIEPVNNYQTNNNNFDNLLSGDKKIVSFVGTTKNGTSFIVNNMAVLLSSMGIDTAIFDATVNRNSYYIFTKNEESLRKIAYDSISKLEQGKAEGIHVNKNLTIYTALPGEEQLNINVSRALETLANNHTLVLIDCDFNTPAEYFSASQEIYLVQSMDVLTIQPLTAFLRDLKTRNVLSQEKLKIIINKAARVRGLSDKVLVGGMAYYNDPSMSFMTELFKKDMVKVITIPFDITVYESYLETLVTCELSTHKYPKMFLNNLKELAGVVYPLLNKQTYKPRQNSYQSANQFSNNMSSTLEKMKKQF